MFFFPSGLLYISVGFFADLSDFDARGKGPNGPVYDIEEEVKR